MNLVATRLDSGSVRALIPSLLPEFDLTQVMARVARDKNWPSDRLIQAERDYRIFLAQCKDNPKRCCVPGRDIDDVWHTHIIHTIQYGKDCNEYFGYFLHHTPYNAANPKPADALGECDSGSGMCGGSNCNGGGISAMSGAPCGTHVLS